MEESPTSCNFLYSTVIHTSVPTKPLSVRITSGLRRRTDPTYNQVRNLIHPPAVVGGRGPGSFSEGDPLNLQPGEMVQVRSLDEVADTLDERRKFKGLYFMPEMEKFCGKDFKVFKRVETIKLESTGEVRKLRSPTVFLEGVYCDGERHEGCDRACFHFWREAWLRRLSTS